jgi:hypothetical protein
MIRAPGQEDEEAAMQSFLFKVNVALFFGSIIAIRTGKHRTHALDKLMKNVSICFQSSCHHAQCRLRPNWHNDPALFLLFLMK